MMKYLLKTVLLLVSVQVFAQTKEEKNYKERAAEVQQEVWNGEDRAFDVTAVPDKFKNSSAVIIARSVEVSNSTKRKFKMITIFGGSVKEFKYFTTIRERVLINDKAALDEFSTINYKKKIDNSVRTGALTFKNTSKAFIGVRVIKSSGKIITVNTDNEEVLTKNTDKEKEGKLAVPDLQTGDIIDYYIRLEELVEFTAETRGPDVYFLGSEYPMVYYNVKYILDKKCGADVMSMNGAKPLKESTSTDDDMVLEFTEKELPAISNTLWTNPERQIPFHIIRYGFPGAGILAGKGEIKHGPFTDIHKKNLKDYLLNRIASGVVDMSTEKKMDEYFGGKKITKEMPADSIVNYLLNFYHWDQYGTFRNLEVGTKRNYEKLSWNNLSISISEILLDYDIPHEMVLVRSRNDGWMKDIFAPEEFESLIKVNAGGKLTWICFNDFFQTPGQLAAKYEGEDAYLLTREGKSRKPKFGEAAAAVKLPVSKSSNNKITEALNVTINSDNLQLLTIERNVQQTGNMKSADQKRLVLAEDAEAAMAALVKKKRSLDYTAASSIKGSKQLAEEIEAALKKERLKQKDYFKEEIKEQYGQEPKELTLFKINNTGLSVKSPVFDFTEKFTMDNFVKKAGNNYIFEVGKLMGEYKKVADKERHRTMDIYMPSARILAYSFVISIPQGYNVKGIEGLNVKVENTIASFVSSAGLNNNQVTITVTREYKNNFEPAANWPLLLQAMDAAADFTDKKILLEKVK